MYASGDFDMIKNKILVTQFDITVTKIKSLL